MKIIIAKKSGHDETVYINASRISSFHAIKNPYNEHIETKIYFPEGKCEIEGDKCQEMCRFMANEDDCGVLDLVGGGKEISFKRYWFGKKEDENGAE